MTKRNERLEQARRYLEEHGFEALIAVSDGMNSFLEANAVWVLGGVRLMGEGAFVLDCYGRSTLIVTPPWDVERAASQSFADETTGTSDLAEGLASVIKAYRVNPARTISVGLPLLGQHLADRIAGALGAMPTPADDLARDLAKIRTAEELAATKHATSIAEQGYDRLLQLARPGIREFELAAELYCYMKSLGAEDNFLLMSASQHNLAVRAAGERVLDMGDILLSEITPCYRGQFAQICRTTVIGEPQPVLSEKYAVLQEAMEHGLAAGRSGAKVTDVTRAINGVFKRAGYGDYCRPPFMRVRGHGLGITSNRPGDLVEGNDRVLEAGMVFVMHPNQYIPEIGYLMCGDTVIVADEGAKSLSTYEARLDFIAV
jgi:Xaa-Pro dipeptidase